MRYSTKSKAIAALIIAALVATITILATTSKAEAQSFYRHTPCPSYSIDDVFADPHGDWDGDGISNWDELDNGQNPCEKDDGTFCLASPGLCKRTGYFKYCVNNTWTEEHVRADPKGDWDGDGISNIQELRNGTNPCLKPCPNPSRNELNAEPYGDWDGDGYNNITEVRHGTNPCNSRSYPRQLQYYTPAPSHQIHHGSGYYVYVPTAPVYVTLPTPTPTPRPVIKPLRNPCPYWTARDVQAQPNLDWDGDGISNSQEVRNGTNPCVSNRQRRSTPTTSACPAGYPYFHPGTGKCHSNPIKPW